MTRRILTVDDDQQLRELIGMFFEQKGFAISTAGDAAAALAKVEAEQPDVVILDINLGKDDGLKVLTQIKETNPQIRVVMMTGFGYDDELLREALQRGADGYVGKALPMEELLGSVNRVLQA